MIGKSGGRSARNRQAPVAEQRSTQRQREHLDPPPGEVTVPLLDPDRAQTAHLVWTPRAMAVGQFLLWSLWIATCCLLALLFGAAFNII